ncbi:DVUA0089 family protein [Variovorax paradoxus]|uniref:Peptidase C-terminal archaeal/bacterial domain-containing protein n=1 Tax=Variovorax paradoxus (strain EPS) TaxID=595537 RepID=E6V9U0_VARPE|nr:DVUA0089 family protein [Variovorax paradoxus]ADU36228.1 hypothetical protein Varpa_2020 [Variovorax paradoxus EPS]
MATLPATYDVRDDFNVDADLSDNASLISSSTGAAGISPAWNGNYTEVTVSGGRLNSITTLANVLLNISPDVVGFTSRNLVGMTVEAEFSTPGSNFSMLRITAFNEDFSAAVGPGIQLNSSGSVFFGLEGDLDTMSPPPASAATHILKMVVTAGYDIEFYVDGVLAGTRSLPATTQWRWEVPISIRNGGYVEYIHVFGNDILESSAPPAPAPPFWTGFVNSYEVGGAAAAPPPPDPEPGEPGESHTNPIDVDVPFELPLPALDGTPVWLRITPGSGNWKFSTATSPDPEIFDTFLALYDSFGNLIASNEDINSGGSDYRSEIIETLVAGTYFLVISTFEGSADNDWAVTGGTTNVPEGAVLVIEEV